MNYSKAQDIARLMAPFDTDANKWLRAMCEMTGRAPTFIIMRYGDPSKWSHLPDIRDNRLKRRVRPKTISAAIKLLDTVMAQNGQAAVALRRRARVMVEKGKYTKTNALIHILKRDGDPRQWAEVNKGLRSKKARRTLSLARPCELEHIDGRRIKARSIVEFCEKAGIPGSRFHISPVLDGGRVVHKDWYLPETLARKVELRDVYGNLTSHTVKELLTKHRMGMTSIGRLLDGRRKSVGLGWQRNSLMLADAPFEATVAPRNIRITKVKLTDGRRVFTGTSIMDAARKAGVTNQGDLYSAAYGFKDEVQGIRIKDIEAEKRSVLSV